MIKLIGLIALTIGIAAIFIGTIHTQAFAACTGNPHDSDSGPTGNPHDPGETGNPHDSGSGHGGFHGGERDNCNGAK